MVKKLWREIDRQKGYYHERETNLGRWINISRLKENKSNIKTGDFVVMFINGQVPIFLPSFGVNFFKPLGQCKRKSKAYYWKHFWIRDHWSPSGTVVEKHINEFFELFYNRLSVTRKARFDYLWKVLANFSYSNFDKLSAKFQLFLKILVNFNLLWLLFWLKLGCFLFQHLFTKQDGLNRAKD